MRASRVPRRLDIVFEDRELIVADKPAGLLTIATETERSRTLYAMLYDYVKRKKPPERIFVVHRLDREASGLLVFAKSPTAKRVLQEQFKERKAGRAYTAVVEGSMVGDGETLRSRLSENRAHRVYSTRDSLGGRLAVTHVRVVRRGRARTLLDLRLESGRKHQIRVQLAERGHPIVGDRAYGSRTNPIRRLALHATRLTLSHPATGRPLEFRSPCPRSIAALVG